MRKRIYSIASIIIGVASIILNSCTNDLFEMIDYQDEKQFEFYVVDNLKISDMPRTWQSQLEFARQEHGINKGENAILLTNYYIVETIESKQQISEVINHIFSDTMATSIETIDGFKLLKVSDYLNAYPRTERDHFAEIKSSLDTIITAGMKVILLEWIQNNRYFNSIAVVSDSANKVIYDNVALKTPIVRKNKHTESMTGGLRDNADYVENNSDGSRTITSVIANKQIDVLGQTSWSYTITMRSTFKSNGILKEAPTAYSSATSDGPFWSCVAGVAVAYAEPNVSSYTSFLYAWGYSDNYHVASIKPSSNNGNPVFIVEAIHNDGGYKNQSYD